MHYVIIDLETTGLDYTKEQVTQVAAMRTDENFNPIGYYMAFAKLHKGNTISEFVNKLTGFTDEFLAVSGVSESNAVQGLCDFIDDSDEVTVVAHHVPFDFSYLSKGAVFPKRFIDTRVLSRLLEPYEKANLDKVAQRYGVPVEGHHSAGGDIEMTRHILAKMKPIADARGIEYVNVVIDSSERPLNFIPENSKVLKFN